MGFPGGSDGEESACNAGDLGSIPGAGRSPGEGNGNPLLYSFLENPHGQKSLADPSLWGHKESDMTEQLSTATVLPKPNQTKPNKQQNGVLELINELIKIAAYKINIHKSIIFLHTDHTNHKHNTIYNFFKEKEML